MNARRVNTQKERGRRWHLIQSFRASKHEETQTVVTTTNSTSGLGQWLATSIGECDQGENVYGDDFGLGVKRRPH